MPSQEEQPVVADGMNIPVDANRVIAMMQNKIAQLTTEVAIKDAVIEQQQEQIIHLQQGIDAATAHPVHEGRVTRPPKKAKANGKK